MRIETLKMFPVKGTLDNQNILAGQAGQTIGKPFSEFLGEAFNNVNSLQHQSRQATIDLAAGRIQDLSEVTIAAEKASIAMSLTLQVRNKVVEAYQEIIRMQA
jgi:flagellar hook-basal body complex protein FliE